MRAVRQAPDGVTVADVAEPDGAGSAVTVRAAAICGSDLHLLDLGPLPVTLGHETAGTLADGTAVAINPAGSCGRCDQCRAGARHRCRTGSSRMLGVALDGGMAERVVVDDDALIRLPAGLDPADGCLVEPLAVATHALRVAGVTSTTRVAVVGAGAIGLGAVAAARALGCDPVGLVARHPHQQAAGERLGATVADTGEYDVVLEAAGSDTAVALAADRCRPGGEVVFVSTHWQPVVMPSIVALMKELRFRWSFTYGTHPEGHDLDDAATLLVRQPDLAATLVTHRFPLEDAPAAFRTAADRRHGSIKVVLEP